MRSFIFGLALSLACGASFAQQPPAAETPKTSATQDLATQQKTERGWFYFEDGKKKPDPEAETPVPPPSMTPPPVAKKPPEDRCKNAATWSTECGFIEPGMNFDFQAKQRDALLVNMTMSPNDPKAVEQFQYYMRWVMGRASEVANLWAFNMVQNPELDPQAKQPISTFGIRMMTDVQKGRADEIYKVLKDEGGTLVFFTKSDCHFCHAMSNSMRRISEDMEIPVRNASLDDKCMPGFEKGCMAGVGTHEPAKALSVTTVPTVFLYVKPNTWIRIATGISDDTTMKERIFSFFSAYRTAMLKGVNNSQKGRPSVDFSFQGDVTGVAEGVKKETAEPRAPSEADISRMLGKQ
jgi:conjugal transfer pilus assembly protein TraF